MNVIEISPKIILVEIIRELGLPDPIYGVKEREGRCVRARLKITIHRGEQLYETFRSMGPPNVEQEKLVEQAVVYSLNDLKHHFNFEVQDANY